MEHTPKNCEKVARDIAESIDIEALKQIAFESIYEAILDSEELFLINLE